jgi:deferrochelatase/peroxidase EfeB
LVLALTAAVGALLALQRPVPFYGAHQAGIVTPPQNYAFVAAFDLTTRDPAEVRQLLKNWTAAAAALTQGQSGGAPTSPSQPPSDTGEAPASSPDHLTVTFGVGPSLFDGRFGLETKRPEALAPLPAFASDRLNPDWSDGDLVVQVCADHPQTAFHAVHTLTRLAQGAAVARWVQAGFAAGRNLEGFLDGTVNPDPRKPEVMNQYVWADGPGWMKGGSYLVVRRIRMFVEAWDRTALAEQEATIGRDKTLGKEDPSRAADSHVSLARGAGDEKLLRRPFNYVNGLDRTGQWDSGLLFLAWMKDPGRQFVPIQTRLSSHDALNEYIRPVGSAVFAVFPGLVEGDYYGSALFPEPSLASQLGDWEAQLGGLFPALAASDWTRLRAGATTADRKGAALRSQAGTHAAALEAAEQAWKQALAPATPDPGAVKGALAALVRVVADWEQSLAPRAPAVSLVKLTDALGQTLKAVAEGDAARAFKAFEGFQREWRTSEALVRGLDSNAYAQVEVTAATARRQLQAGDLAAAEALQSLERLLSALKPPPAPSGAGTSAFWSSARASRPCLCSVHSWRFWGERGSRAGNPGFGAERFWAWGPASGWPSCFRPPSRRGFRARPPNWLKAGPGWRPLCSCCRSGRGCTPRAT